MNEDYTKRRIIGDTDEVWQITYDFDTRFTFFEAVNCSLN